MVNWLMREVETGRLLPSIPEYAIDMHTARGQKQGRDVRHFLQEGAVVSPELETRETVYRERLLKLLDQES